MLDRTMSRIALHNVTILQGVTLNSFDEDNNVPQRGVVRWINFFIESFFCQIQTSSLFFALSLSLSVEMQLFFIFFLI